MAEAESATTGPPPWPWHLLSTGPQALPASAASADTHKSEQNSTVSGPTAAVLPPGSGPGDNRQLNNQDMTKRDTGNVSSSSVPAELKRTDRWGRP
jgi:hypothetical protein